MSLRALIEQLADFDTALLANTVGHFWPGEPPQDWYLGGEIRSQLPLVGPTVGVAMTLELDSSTPGNVGSGELYWRLLESIQASSDPVFLAIKAVGSRPDHECVLGDGMAKMLHSVGCAGIVTDGGVRDLEGVQTVPFGVYARGRVVHHCALRYVSVNRPVELGGVTIRPGEILHANAGGVIKLPRADLERLPARATEMRAFEQAAHGVFRRTDLTLAQKRTELERLVGGLGTGGR